MRLTGLVLLRTGLILIGLALLGGIGAAIYALAAGIEGILGGDIVGEKAALKHLILYPLAAGVAGSILALPGLVLSYLGENTLERHRATSATNGAR